MTEEKPTLMETIESRPTPDWLTEICENCGRTLGRHHAGTSPHPLNLCPGPVGKMDWENSPGTVFAPSGKHKREEN